jgi:predicted permease
MGEIRLAVRSLLKTKLFTVVAIVTLMIGIGATTAVFSVFDAVALRALPFTEPEALVDVEEWSATELCAGCGVGMSRPTFTDLQKRATSFEDLAAFSEIPVNVGGLEAPERVSAAEVSGNFFNVLGVRPTMGRTLDANDDRVGVPAVVVVSTRYFANRLGSDPTKIGGTIRINGQPTTIIGVMPATAVLPEFAQIWLPLGRTPIGTDRAARDLGVIGRLKRGVSRASAESEMKTIASDLERAYPETQKDWTIRLRGLRQAVGDGDVPVYGLMLASVVVLWAIVCANLAGLLLARGIGRRREIAVRLALGANRSDVVWHLFAESVCLAAVGGILGAIASAWTVDLLLASLDTAIPSWLTPRLDGWVLGFCLLLSGLSAVAAGLLPAVRASRPNVHDDLKAGGQTSLGGGKSTLRGSLVVLQLALSLVLLAVAGVLTATIQSLAGREGNEGSDVVQARVALLGDTSSAHITSSIDAFVKRLGALPEARAAAASGSGFIAGFGGRDQQISVEGLPVLPEGVSPRFYLAVTPRYFETVGTQLREGRSFEETDRAGAAPVAIIGRRLANQLWNGQNAVGRRIRLGGDSLPWRTVVGVIEETADTAGRSNRNMAYVPFAQMPTREATLLIAARRNPASILKTVREAARSVDPDLPLLDLMTSVAAHAQVWRPYRSFAMTISAIGAIALALSAIGLYGVIAYGAEQRTREIGLRIALGARPGDVVQLITTQGLRLVTVGIVLGLVAALAVMPLMRNMMFGLDPMNPSVFALSALLLVAVAAVASYLPARRAAATDPMVALRND